MMLGTSPNYVVNFLVYLNNTFDYFISFYINKCNLYVAVDSVKVVVIQWLH